MNNSQFLALPNEIMKSDNPLHYEFFNFNNNIDFKVFLMILSISTMLYKDNGLKKQTFTLNGLLSRDTYLPRSKLNFEKLESIINNLNPSPFFKSIIVKKSLLNPTKNTEENEEEVIKHTLTNSLNKCVELELSDEYLDLINNKKNGFNKIKLEELKSCREIKATKLKVITMMKPKGYLHLNYLLKVLSINCNLNRTDKIRQIKRAFNGINIEFEYKHPKRDKKKEMKPEYYKFHYDTLITENKNNLDDIKF
ncbi:hypothetical protein ACBZ37_003175 [Vibrio cholerae]